MKKNLSHIKKTALVSALLIEIGTGAQAANIAVDGTTCTLADAITAANTDAVAGGCTAGAGDDILDLPVNDTFTLTAEPPAITTNVTINANGTTIARDPGAGLFVVLSAAAGGSLTLNDATVTGGQADAAENLAGGISAFDAQLILSNSTVSGNTGGAVRFIRGVSSSITNSVIEYNTGISGSQYYTGGVIINGGEVDIQNTTISGNSADSTNAGGGGLYVTDYSGAVTVGVSNSTISGNTSTINGGGIATYGFGNGIELNLNSVTVTLNSTAGNGGGIHSNGGDVAVSQSLLSGNTATSANQWESVGGAYITVDAYNIFGESSASGLTGVTPGSYDIVPTVGLNEIIDTNLIDNGGPTPTHALIETGPAVDAILNCLFSNDQAGKSRPIDGNADGTALCDVGAFENENPDVIFKNGFNDPFN